MRLQYNKQDIEATIVLPGSKSISNRLLVLDKVLGLDLHPKNLSPSKDTAHLLHALQQINTGSPATINIGDAGTDMRFLTALLSVTEGEWLLTGSARMKDRPLQPLVTALRDLGADIAYPEKDGFAPLKITGKKLKGGSVEIDAGISSQFISALLLIAPSLENGLQLVMRNKIVSWSYIKMTLDILSEFGVKTKTNDHVINILPYQAKKERYEMTVESDWTSASYWYSIAALAPRAKILLTGLNRQSSQGDSVLPELYKQFGVASQFKGGDLLLEKIPFSPLPFVYDFTNCPDIAQTVAVTCFGLNIPAQLNGLSTLKDKETDRLQALKTELEKFGARVEITTDSLKIHGQQQAINQHHVISTYGDHRMAMSFAPLACIKNNIVIQNPEVVEKSYPQFWSHLQLAGINSK